MSAPRTRLGGFGAVFFIATLGAIAFYVQRQTVPDTHDAVRTAVHAAGRAERRRHPGAHQANASLQPHRKHGHGSIATPISALPSPSI